MGKRRFIPYIVQSVRNLVDNVLINRLAVECKATVQSNGFTLIDRIFLFFSMKYMLEYLSCISVKSHFKRSGLQIQLVHRVLIQLLDSKPLFLYKAFRLVIVQHRLEGMINMKVIF